MNGIPDQIGIERDMGGSIQKTEIDFHDLLTIQIHPPPIP